LTADKSARVAFPPRVETAGLPSSRLFSVNFSIHFSFQTIVCALVLALVSEADYLVTGDRDLLVLKDNFSCPIVTADDFCNLIGF
jgi:hypothetical protein